MLEQQMFLDSVFIKFGDGWIKLLGESDKFGEKKTRKLLRYHQQICNMFREKASLNQLLKLILMIHQLILYIHIFFKFLGICIEHYQAHILQHIQDVYENFLLFFHEKIFGTRAHPILILTRIISILKAGIKTFHCHVCKL